ncbi:hypothetical protein PENTCL1PPCAC_19033, partial [Pristionchus entomophagus]
ADRIVSTPTQQPKEGFRLEVTNDNNLKLYLDHDARIKDCEFSIGSFKFNCLLVSETVSGVTVDYIISERAYTLKSNEQLADVCGLYKEAKQIMKLS